MRKLVVHMQTTLNSRIADSAGGFWEPFAWGEPEQAYINECFRAADTWVLSRVMYEAIVPWWDEIAAGRVPDGAADLTASDREFAALLRGMRKVVASRTSAAGQGRDVISGDLVASLQELKSADGATDVLLSCGPRTLGPIAESPGLVDEYLVVVHPAVLAAGPRMFDEVGTDLALELVVARVFDAGAVVLRYRNR